MKIKISGIRINKVVKILILSDTALLTGLGLIAPIFAIFITDNIQGGNVEVAGFAASVYWIILSLLLIPSGKYLDRKQGEKDDLCFIIIGNILAAIAVFGYTFSYLPYHIYLLQAIYAIGMSMNIPGYTAIFTRHVDKGKEAFSWSSRAAFVGIGTGVAGSLGGIIVYRFGFETLFIGAGFFIIFSAFLPFLIRKELILRDKKIPTVPPTKIIKSPVPKE